MSELHDLSAAEQISGLRARTFSARDLVQHYLSRIERWDGELGAFTTTMPALALQDADRADRLLADGHCGPLTGLPLGIKDLYGMTGAPTSYGSAAIADRHAGSDTWTVGLLRQAGAVFVGKTSTPEFGAACFTDEGVARTPAVTPYDLGCYASGSSAGAARAVAAGLLPLAHGSDGAGSIRTPASVCHLVGLKPSRGLVSSAPAAPVFSTGTEGAIARTVADAALLLEVMAQPSAGDLYGWSAPGTFTRAVSSPPTRALRIAMWTDTGVDLPAHRDSLTAVHRTAALLTELGHDVQEIPIPARWEPSVRTAVETWFGSAVAVAVEALVPAQRRERLTPYTQHLLTLGERLSARELIGDNSVLARYAGTFLTTLADYDVALTPTTAGPPVNVGHFVAEGPERVVERMLAWSCYTPWVNLAGAPAISVPAHLDEAGLPHGVQLIGKHGADAALLSLAAQLEAAAPWADIHPKCWLS